MNKKKIQTLIVAGVISANTLCLNNIVYADSTLEAQGNVKVESVIEKYSTNEISEEIIARGNGIEVQEGTGSAANPYTLKVNTMEGLDKVIKWLDSNNNYRRYDIPIVNGDTTTYELHVFSGKKYIYLNIKVDSNDSELIAELDKIYQVVPQEEGESCELPEILNGIINSELFSDLSGTGEPMQDAFKLVVKQNIDAEKLKEQFSTLSQYNLEIGLGKGGEFGISFGFSIVVDGQTLYFSLKNENLEVMDIVIDFMNGKYQPGNSTEPPTENPDQGEDSNEPNDDESDDKPSEDESENAPEEDKPEFNHEVVELVSGNGQIDNPFEFIVKDSVTSMEFSNFLTEVKELSPVLISKTKDGDYTVYKFKLDKILKMRNADNKVYVTVKVKNSQSELVNIFDNFVKETGSSVVNPETQKPQAPNTNSAINNVNTGDASTVGGYLLLGATSLLGALGLTKKRNKK